LAAARPACEWKNLIMADSWKKVTASQVAPGETVRLGSNEFVVARIESPFLGREELVAFIEDTPTRWHKQPVPVGTEVEVLVQD
jgi:hypothetical protein